MTLIQHYTSINNSSSNKCSGICTFFFFLMIRRPPRSTLFPTRRSSDLTSIILEIANKATWLTGGADGLSGVVRSEEHTSELQSRLHLVCRLLLEKKKNKQ